MSNAVVSAETLAMVMQNKIPITKINKYIGLFELDDVYLLREYVDGTLCAAARKAVERVQALAKQVEDNVESSPSDKETASGLVAREQEHLLDLYTVLEKVDKVIQKAEKQKAKAEHDEEDKIRRRAAKALSAGTRGRG